MFVEVMLVVIFIVLAMNVQRLKTNQRISSSEYESLLKAIHTFEGENEKMLERVQIIVDDILVRESLGEMRGRELRGDDWSKLVRERKKENDE